MEAVDKYVADSAGTGHDFCPGPSPSWLKICQAQAFIPQAADMIPGMYFTREHFQRLRDDPRFQGSRGTRFGYANVPSCLDNTMFNRLMETGLIGTTGLSTGLLHDQIVLSFEGHKSLVVATLHGDDIPAVQAEHREMAAAEERLRLVMACGENCRRVNPRRSGRVAVDCQCLTLWCVA